MRFGVICSCILHLGLFLVVMFGLPNFARHIPEEVAISVEMLPITDISNLKNQSKNVPKQEDKPSEAKTIVKAAPPEEQEVPKPAEKKPEPKTPEEIKPEAVVVKKEEKPKEEPKVVKEEKKPEPKKKPEKPKEDKPKKKKEKPHNFDLDAIEKSLEDSADQKTDKATKNDTSAKKVDQSDHETKGKHDPSADLSISEIDAVLSYIVQKWNIPHVKGIKGMRVCLEVDLDQNKNVVGVKIIEQQYGDQGDASSFSIFAESAIRAAKMALPGVPDTILKPERYSNWKKFRLNFDPSGIIS